MRFQVPLLKDPLHAVRGLVADRPRESEQDPGYHPCGSPHTGSFAYSPLNPVLPTDISSLNFVADYEGKTVAVHHATGDPYEGQIRLVASWETSPTVESTITDLRGLSGSRPYFKHDTQDAMYIFFNGITADGGELGGTLNMSVRYRNSSRYVSVGNRVTIDGVFVKGRLHGRACRRARHLGHSVLHRN